jgi:hypothetical protein
MAADELARLLSEGLDLCVRARHLDALDRRAATLAVSSDPEGWLASGRFDQHVEAHNRVNPAQQIEARSLTPRLWVQEQYERDLHDWENRARAAMVRLGFAQ